MDVDPSDTASEASYFEQEPISGAVLLDQELLHREACSARGNIFTGCEELDHHVLLGGLARGRVVGLSAEEESFGLLFGLQVIARLLVSGDLHGDASRRPSAMIITTLSHTELLPTLRRVVKGQVEALPGAREANTRVKAALERVSISRVFDFDGLREALDELDLPVKTGHLQGGGEVPAQDANETLEKPQSSTGHQKEAEIRDSEDEDEHSSPASPASLGQPPFPAKSPDPEQPPNPPQGVTQPPQEQYPTPDIVLITNIPTLITSLYATCDRKHAHRMLRHLSSRLRYLTRSPSHGGPLFLLLNSTTSKPPPKPARPTDDQDQQQQDQQQQDQQRQDQQQPPSSAPSTPLSQSSLSSSSSPHSPLDQLPPGAAPGEAKDTAAAAAAAALQQRKRDREEELDAVRSLFNPPPPDPGGEEGEVDEYGYARHPNPDFALLARLARRNRPFWGLRFGGMVDVHLLATRVPRTDGDAEVFYAGVGRDGEGEVVVEGVRLVWVVEVLGDGAGVWVEDPEVGEEVEELGMDEGGDGRRDERVGRRFNREQRWAGVEVWEEGGGMRVVDAPGFGGVDVRVGDRGVFEEEEEEEVW